VFHLSPTPPVGLHQKLGRMQGLVSPLTAGLQDVVRAVVAGLGWSSLANVQLVMGVGGPTVYEINPRAAGSIGLNSYAGVDLLSAAIHLARTGTAPENLGDSVAETVRFRRYWLDQWWPAPAEPGWP